MKAKGALMWVKEITYFREFRHLNNSRIRKKYYFKVYEFLEEWIHVFVAKLDNRCFCLFPSATLVLIQISINFLKTFLRISRIRNIPLTWILARVFEYSPPFISQILDFIYWTVLILILIYFERRDTENQQYGYRKKLQSSLNRH